MKYSILIVAALFFSKFCFSQTDTTYFFKEVGMHIKLPVTFEIVSAEEDQKKRENGEKLMEEANHMELDVSSTKTLLSFRQGQFNYVNITVTPFEEREKNDWEKNNEFLKEAVYKSFVGKVPASDIDTTSSSVIIDGIELSRFVMNIKLKAGVTMKMVVLSKFYKGYDFGICYVYINELIGKEIEDIIFHSTFKR
jgi:hypothetical protein